MRHTQRCADTGDKTCLTCRFGSQTMIDGRSFDSTRQCCMGQQQQRQTVRAARDGQTKGQVIAAQRCQIGSEPRGQFGIGRERAINCTSPQRGSYHTAP